MEIKGKVFSSFDVLRLAIFTLKNTQRSLSYQYRLNYLVHLIKKWYYNCNLDKEI